MALRISLFLVFLVIGSSHARAKDTSRIRVVTLHTILTEIAREVGGEEVDVTALMRPGADPHVFEPSPADLRRLTQADLVLAAGLGLESYLPRLVGEIEKDHLVEVGNRLPNLLKHGPSEPAAAESKAGHVATHDHDRLASEKNVDPHWWHGVSQVIAAVDLVEGEFTARRPSHKATFTRNASTYRAQLRALHARVVAELSPLPAERRHLITTHDAFGYFARDHGFTVHSLLGLSTDAEADARRVAAIVDLIRREKIKAVFAERSANSRIIEAVLRDTGAKLGGTLYADGLGMGPSADTYEGMLRHNIETIVAGLR